MGEGGCRAKSMVRSTVVWLFSAMSQFLKFAFFMAVLMFFRDKNYFWIIKSENKKYYKSA